MSAAALRARLGNLLTDKIEISTTSPYADCTSIEDMASQMLDGMTNARWLQIDDEDRLQLAELIRDYWGRVQAFLDEVNRRPLQQEPIALITNGKGNQ